MTVTAMISPRGASPRRGRGGRGAAAVALAEACRPANMLFAAAAALAGALLAGGAAALAAAGPWLAAAATALSLAAGNLWNDVADQAEDAVNRPARPLPSGRLAAAAARRAAALLALAALAAGMVQDGRAFLLVAGCLALLAWYARRGKEAGLAGNAAVAALGGVAVGYGAFSTVLDGQTADPGRALVPAALAALLHLVREVAKDAEDREGDRAAGRRTWVLAAGSSPAGAAALRRLLGQLAVALALPPVLGLLLGPPVAALRAAHLAALGVSPLVLAAVLGGDPGSRAWAARLARRAKLLLALGLALYTVAALL